LIFFCVPPWDDMSIAGYSNIQILHLQQSKKFFKFFALHKTGPEAIASGPDSFISF